MTVFMRLWKQMELWTEFLPPNFEVLVDNCPSRDVHWFLPRMLMMLWATSKAQMSFEFPSLELDILNYFQSKLLFMPDSRASRSGHSSFLPWDPESGPCNVLTAPESANNWHGKGSRPLTGRPRPGAVQVFPAPAPAHGWIIFKHRVDGMFGEISILFQP